MYVVGINGVGHIFKACAVEAFRHLCALCQMHECVKGVVIPLWFHSYGVHRVYDDFACHIAHSPNYIGCGRRHGGYEYDLRCADRISYRVYRYTVSLSEFFSFEICNVAHTQMYLVTCFGP